MSIDWKDRYRTHEPIVIDELVLEEIDFLEEFIGQNSKISDLFNRTLGTLTKVESKLKVESNDIISLLNIVEDLKEEDILMQDVITDRYEVMANILMLKLSQLTGTYGCEALSEKEANLFHKKIITSCKKLQREVMYVKNVYSEYVLDMYQTLNEYLDNMKKILKPEELIDIKELKEIKSKIFSYKDMCSVAEEKGYELARSCGDHMVYKHKESRKIVVIPAHILGKGLMYSIQKQISERVC